MPHPSVKWSVSAILLIAAVLLQTAAPAVWAQPAAGSVRAIPVAQGLENPWAVAFLPEGRFVVTERPGRLRVVEADGRLNPPVAGLPPVAAGGQGGLLDVVLDNGFASNRTLYFCFSEPAPAGAAGNSTALARARLSEDRTRLEDVRVIFSQRPKVASSLHFGCRIVEGMKDGRPDGTLLADARTTIETFEEKVGPVLTDEEREADIDTLGGLVMSLTEDRRAHV